MYVVTTPRRSTRLAQKRANAIKTFKEDFSLEAPASERAKIIMPFINSVLTELKHYTGSLQDPSVTEPSKAVLEVPEVPPQPRRSARLNTESYKLNAEARKSYLEYEDAQLRGYLKSEAFKRSIAKNRYMRELERTYWSRPSAITLMHAKAKATQQAYNNYTTGNPDRCIYREMVQEFYRLFKWNDELKLLSADCD